MRCRLTRLNSVHQNLRTDEIEGDCTLPPTERFPFIMTAKPLEPAASIRIIQTTKVAKVTPAVTGKIVEFETENSVYKWEEL